jgi:Lrp/AsnC family leucine-responsive transcriptional regulator
MTNLELADRIGISPSPCLRRLRQLESSRVIKRYAARLDREKVGLGLSVFIAVKVKNHGDAEAKRFREAVSAMSEVVACFITSGVQDFLLEVVVPDLAEYRRFVLDRLLKTPGVQDIQSSFVIDTIKDDAPLPLRHVK